MTQVKDLGRGVQLIDLMDIGKAERTGAYVLEADDLTIIETSASPSIPYLLNGLKELGIKPEEVKNIIVTHIHLDHSGGAGLLLQSCPNATVYVHPKGERHLADPSRLIMSAKGVYGEDFDRLFDPILPIPEGQLKRMEDGGKLKIGSDRTLTFLHTPGHANHHFSIHDSESNGVFTGDTIGVSYPQLLELGVELYLPSTSPNQFHEEAMLQSADRIEALQPDRIYFGHYGMSKNPVEVFRQLRFWLPQFMESGRKAASAEGDFSEKAQKLSKDLISIVNDYLADKETEASGDVKEILELDLTVGGMGIIHRLSKD